MSVTAREKRRPTRERGGATLLCSSCKTPTRVMRTKRVEGVVTRERACPECGRLETTEERRVRWTSRD